MRSCFESSAPKGSVAMSLAFTSRCSPLAVSVITMTGRRAARSIFTCVSVSSFTIDHLLDEDADGAAAGQSDIPGGLVSHAEFQHFGFAAGDHVQRLGDHGALDAAAGDAP